jgi:hypothetical protein
MERLNQLRYRVPPIYIYIYIYTTSWKVAGSSSDEVIYFFLNLPNPSSRNTALKFTQPLTEMSTRSFWGKARSASKANILNTICEQIF